jgi:hypothetical protein
MKYDSIYSYSQSKFEILKKNKKFFIKKYPKKMDSRELDSIKKQNSFLDFKTNNFKIVSAKIILDKNKFTNKKYYLIEYHQGKNSDQILQLSNKYEINILKNFFYSYFQNNLRKLEFTLLDKNILLSKIEEIEKKVIDNELKKISYKYFFLAKKNFKKDIYYPNSNQCHGDLTLSNIIVNSDSKKIILIDFQKTYNDNIIQDLSKIYQEFELHWSARYLSNFTSIRANIVYKSIIDNQFWSALNSNVLKSLNSEILMTLLRIFPYVKKNDKITLKWLIKSLNKIV